MPRARPTDYRDADYTEVFRERKARLRKVREDKAWHLLKRYYADGHYIEFIEDWLVTYDPRNSARQKPTLVPFLLFPLQSEYIAWLQDRKAFIQDGICEKSRDMGISWCSLAFAVCELLFSPGANIAFGSRKEDLVDNLGDMDSLLEKVRFMLRYLPEELQPKGYDEKKHAKHMSIRNPENGASITGEAGDNIGRGGRSTMYFVDEAAFLERPEKIDAALSQNTSSRIDVSTPNGKDNPFALKRHAGVVPVFTFHWTSDPRKDQAWYDAEVRRINDPQIIAQELDLDYNASGEQTVIDPKWVRSSRKLRAYLRQESLLPRVHVADGVAGVDIGANKAETTYVPRWGPIVGEPTCWIEDDTTNAAYKARELALADGIGVVKYDAVGVGKGVSSTFKRIEDIETQGINVGEGATNKKWPDKKRAKDKFQNLKAELWWTLRDKLYRTHKHWLWVQGKEGGEEQDLDDLLLMPMDVELGVQMCIPGFRYLDSGKIQIERKEALKLRGVKSPDRVEAVIVGLAPNRPRARMGRTAGVI